MVNIKSFDEFTQATVNEGDGIDPQIKKEVVDKLSQFFGVSASAINKFKFDGTDNVKELTKALNGTDYEGVDHIVRVAVAAAKRNAGVSEQSAETKVKANVKETQDK